MAILLGIETATEVCSVCISRDDQIIAERTIADGRRHSRELTSLIRECIDQAEVQMSDVDAVVLSDGPGSYTGLRVGASSAKGLCSALDKPMISVPTLRSLTTPHGDATVMATIDARRMEAYAAIYSGGEVVRDIHSFIWSEDSCAALAAEFERLIICGDGVEKAKDLLSVYDNIEVRPSFCDATLLMSIGYQKYQAQDFEDVAYYDPNYFKSPKITASKKQLL